MIYNVISGQIAEGKTKEAIAWAAKIAAYNNQRFPGTNVQILRNINGYQDRLHYIETYESMGALEAADKELETDEALQALVKEGQGLFVPGTTQRNMYQVVA
jgi:hypothetical protein